MGSFRKIPANAQKVYQGVLHSVYHWQQEMLDGTHQTFEALRRNPSVTILALTPTGKILVIEEEQPYNGYCVTIPGGTAETDDLFHEARRELLEETGYQSDNWRLWTTIDVVPYAKLEWKSYFYIAHSCRRASTIVDDPGERLSVRRVTIDEFFTIINREDFAIDYLKAIAADKEQLAKLKKLLTVRVER